MKSTVEIFSLRSPQLMASQLAQDLGLACVLLHEDQYPDGEISISCRRSVRGGDLIVLHSLSRDELNSPNENLMRLLMTLNLLRESGARSLTVVAPYLCYARSDERRVPGDPLALKYTARLLEASGLNRLITLDVHNISAFENAFQCEVHNLEAASLFATHLKSEIQTVHRLVVLSPDFGGIKRAHRFKESLERLWKREIDFAYLEKYRTKTELQGHALAGNVQDACVFIYDDMISTGQTILRAAEACRNNGAQEIFVVASHGLFSAHPDALFYSDWIDRIFVTDSNPHLLRPEFSSYPKLKVLTCTPLLSQSLKSLLGPEIAEAKVASVPWEEGQLSDFV